MMARLRANPWSPTWLVASALIVALVALATMAPLRGAAYGEPTVLRPERFVAVTVDVSPREMRSAQLAWPIRPAAASLEVLELPRALRHSDGFLPELRRLESWRLAETVDTLQTFP